MSALWTINGAVLADRGLEMVGGTFSTGNRSVMTLRKTGDFTADDVFAWGQEVTLRRNGVRFFQGKVNSLPHSASETDESQEIEIVDAWQDLEETIYKEPWGKEAGSVMLPVAILGRKPNGTPCTDAEQIAAAVNYAASVGVAIQMGSIPAGLPLWQSEVRNVAVAEVIRISLRFHPDWVPWIDHATMPPTLNFTARASMTAQTIDIGDGDTSSVSITRRDDLKPAAVSILYLNAAIIDGVTYRDSIEDKYPEAGPSAGPRVISNVIELAGAQMQFQKQRIQTRTLPTDDATMREWLKKKFPQIKDISDEVWSVFHMGNTLIPQEPIEDLPEPVNPRATRIEVDELDDLPRELVAGSIEDWMRRKVGRVKVAWAMAPGPDATAAERKLLDPIAAMEGKTLTATNAVTKIYKGVTQWEPAENAPTGIAQAIYTALSAYQYEGSITTVMEDVSGTRYHGTKLNIDGGRGEWAAMNAMVHSVSFDIATGRTTISVGPAPFLAAADMLELQRLIRGRGVTWMSEKERTSNELGAADDPGSKGDTVGGFTNATEDTFYKKSRRFLITYNVSENKLYVSPGTVAMGPDSEDQVIRPVMPTIGDPKKMLTEVPAPSFDCSGKVGSYEVLCYFGGDEAEIKLAKKGEGEAPAEGEELFLLGTVEFGGEVEPKIEQEWESDIAWPMEASSSSSSDDDSSDGGGGGPAESSGDESDKSTAIVPAAWTKGGFTALYTVEAPDVRFEDVLRSSLEKPVTRLKLDPRFIAVCEPGSIDVVSLVPERPMSIGAKMAGGFVVITRPARSKACQVTVSVSGIRKGFAGRRWPDLDRAFFDANEKFLKSARPKQKP